MASLPPTYGNSTAYLKNIAFGYSAAYDYIAAYTYSTACSKYATFGCSAAYDYIAAYAKNRPDGPDGSFTCAVLDGGLWVKTEITELRCVMLFIAGMILNIAELRFAISRNGQAVG